MLDTINPITPNHINVGLKIPISKIITLIIPRFMGPLLEYFFLFFLIDLNMNHKPKNSNGNSIKSFIKKLRPILVRKANMNGVPAQHNPINPPPMLPNILFAILY